MEVGAAATEGRNRRNRGNRGTENSPGERADNQQGVGGGKPAGGNQTDKNLHSEVRGKSKPVVVENIESVQAKIPDVPKEKKERKPREKKNQSPVSEKDMNALLIGVFDMVSMKAGEHWRITEKEADSVTKPLCRILEKNNLLEKVANVSDGAMLAVAAASITVPRVIVSQALYKNKKAGEKIGIKLNTAPAAGNEKAANDKESIIKDNGGSENTISSGGDFLKSFGVPAY